VAKSRRIDNTSALSTNPAALFAAAAQAEIKANSVNNPRLLTGVPPGIVETVISSFLGFTDNNSLVHVNKKLHNNDLLLQNLLKQLLVELVGAFQEPNPKYSQEQADALLTGTFVLASNHPVEAQLAQSIAGKFFRVEEIGDLRFPTAFAAHQKQALAKSILLELLRAHQLFKAKALIQRFPAFLNNKEDNLDYLFALMVSDYQNEAEALIKHDPELLLMKGKVVDHDGQIYPDITPYQLALCYMHTRMYRLIRKYLPNETAALQSQEYELVGCEEYASASSAGLEALKEKYNALPEKFRIAFEYFKSMPLLLPETADSYLNRDNYVNRKIGGLMKELPVHLMKEFFYPREFKADTPFSSPKIMEAALPEARYRHTPIGEAFYPWDQGYKEATLWLNIMPREEKLNANSLAKTDSPQLIKSGDRFYVYGPMRTTTINENVVWGLQELDTKTLPQSAHRLFQERYSDVMPVIPNGLTIAPYKPALFPLFALVDNALQGGVLGFGFSFNFALSIQTQPHYIRLTGHGYDDYTAHDPYPGLAALYTCRGEERFKELSALRSYLPKPEAEPEPPRTPSPFR